MCHAVVNGARESKVCHLHWLDQTEAYVSLRKIYVSEL